MERQLQWVYWMWCVAHRLELAIKDALSSSLFHALDELLLRLYYLYKKSPKKFQELKNIVSDLGECFEFDDNGVKPLCASGSRWVTYRIMVHMLLILLSFLRIELLRETEQNSRAT